jgi:hypothetical protein
MRQALAVVAAVVAAVLLAGGAYALGAARGDDDSEPVALVETTTTERPTTTVRPTTTTTVPTTTTSLATTPPTTVWYPPQDSEIYSYDEPVCDMACTEDLMDRWGDPPPTTATTQRACRPSTFTACDPGEPMELPFGCDVLVETFDGRVKCAD